MELNVLTSSKTKLTFEMVGEDHTYCNLLRDTIWNEKGVIGAGYTIKHPLVGTPKFIIEVESGDAKDALVGAAQAIKKQASDFEKAFLKM
jgi:DNA-directed RNA polymerase subunit L